MATVSSLQPHALFPIPFADNAPLSLPLNHVIRNIMHRIINIII